MTRNARPLAPAALALLALAACNPTLSAESTAPPGRTARLDEVHGFWGQIKSYRLELSQGVALAVTCHRGGPCERLSVTSDDPAIADARPAALGTLEPNGNAGRATASAFVIIGHAAGTTHLHLRSGAGSRTIAVTVVAPRLIPPPPSATVTRISRD
ncbi:MAG TPA: hypothetical protein VL172_19765 [Kofleriaceae bacterium]|nr:hypothetical protein [Kofleriaceae bacterium]